VELDFWQIANSVLGVVGVGAVTLVKMLWKRSDDNAKSIQEAKDALVAFKVEAAEKYVRYEVLGKLRDEIIGHLQRIEDRMDRKVDKE